MNPTNRKSNPTEKDIKRRTYESTEKFKSRRREKSKKPKLISKLKSLSEDKKRIDFDLEKVRKSLKKMGIEVLIV